MKILDARLNLWMLGCLLLLISGCARMPSITKTSIKAITPTALHTYLRGQPAELREFRSYGPFDVVRKDNLALSVPSAESVPADLFLSSHREKAPLVIFLHGNAASKALHAYQALHVATWGMHGLTVQLPNDGPWYANAQTLSRVVHAIQQGTVRIDDRIDAGRLILIGHSYGAAAVAIALARGAPAMGGILLDPAAIDGDMPKILLRIRTPVIIIGADEHVTETRDRAFFFRYIPGGVSELSIKDATHEDAQFPADSWSVNETQQITFASALTAAALSLHMSGKFDYAWASFRTDLANGTLLNARKK